MQSISYCRVFDGWIIHFHLPKFSKQIQAWKQYTFCDIFHSNISLLHLYISRNQKTTFMAWVVFQFHVNLIKANKSRLHLCIRNTDINYECDRCPILIIVTLVLLLQYCLKAKFIGQMCRKSIFCELVMYTTSRACELAFQTSPFSKLKGLSKSQKSVYKK